MKSSFIPTVIFLLLIALPSIAQDRTTVTATSSEISDNLDLRAIASIFGEAKDLEDFERQLNDPKSQISNLDLNDDNQVDYLRVIESVEDNTHLIIIQSVLDKDNYQDVATIEVEKDNNNQIQVQVVGNVYMYGQNYIYEPVYVGNPIIYNTFWVPTYRPYHSLWYWNYYPTFYFAWRPFPLFKYRRHIALHINQHYHYNYVNVRRSQRAALLYEGKRSDYLERIAPDRSFSNRNIAVKNSYELSETRKIKNGLTRNETPNTRGRDSETTGKEIKNIRNNSNENGVKTGRELNSTRNNDINTLSKPDKSINSPTNHNNPGREREIRNENSQIETRSKSQAPREIRQNTPTRERSRSRLRNENQVRQRNLASPRRS